MGPHSPHPPNPSPELLLSCPRCRGRVIALTLADPPGAALLRWFGRCSLCRATVRMTAGLVVAAGGEDEG